jgi:hypothetical protein
MSWIKAINDIGGAMDFVDEIDPEVVIISLEVALDMQKHNFQGVNEFVLALRKDRIKEQIKLFKKRYNKK